MKLARLLRCAAPLVMAASAAGASAACSVPRTPAAGATPAATATYTVTIPGTLVTFEMVRLPGTTDVASFDIGRTEVTWDMYDAFALRDDDATHAADAVAGPSEPYGAPDYGWGHAGFPAISITREAAEAFCAWLSQRTGHHYRLPTEDEWQHAADLAVAATPGASLDAVAWHRGNADGRTHAVATRAPDALGLYDLFGNAAEWVTREDDRRVVRGGSFRDALADTGPHAAATQTSAWNERDPQLPKSRWWLSDGPFAGFRIVREPAGAPAPTTPVR